MARLNQGFLHFLLIIHSTQREEALKVGHQFLHPNSQLEEEQESLPLCFISIKNNFGVQKHMRRTSSPAKSYNLGFWSSTEHVQMPHMLFTGLEDYKARGTQASPYFTVSHYTEFADTKDLVLIRGDVVFPSKLGDPERFNKETHDFEFKDVLQALEMPTL